MRFVTYLLLSIVAVMLLWNLLAPAILGLAVINFWQAAGVFVLCRILFGNIIKDRGGGNGQSS